MLNEAEFGEDGHAYDLWRKLVLPVSRAAGWVYRIPVPHCRRVEAHRLPETELRHGVHGMMRGAFRKQAGSWIVATSAATSPLVCW